MKTRNESEDSDTGERWLNVMQVACLWCLGVLALVALFLKS